MNEAATLAPISILLVEDDALWAELFSAQLSPLGKVTVASNLTQALQILSAKKFQLALIDLDLGAGESDRMAGLKVITKASSLGIYCVVASVYGQDEIVQRGFQFGCMDYVTKPVKKQALDLVFARYEAWKSESDKKQILKDKFVTQDQETKEVLELVHRLSHPSSGTSTSFWFNKSLLISGDTGTGKFQLAKLIHEVGNTKGESIILQGSSHGFSAEKKILNDLCKMVTQGKIIKPITLVIKSIENLTVEEIRHVLKVTDKIKNKNALILIATSKYSLETLLNSGKINREIYQKLKTFSLSLKPYRERSSDILLLIDRWGREENYHPAISPQSKKYLLQYSWPKGAYEAKELFSSWKEKNLKIIRSLDLGPEVRGESSAFKGTILSDEQWQQIEQLGLASYLKHLKREVIERSMQEAGGRQSLAATKLKLGRSHFNKLVHAISNNNSDAKIETRSKFLKRREDDYVH